jgi:hypothetical protein
MSEDSMSDWITVLPSLNMIFKIAFNSDDSKIYFKYRSSQGKFFIIEINAQTGKINPNLVAE